MLNEKFPAYYSKKIETMPQHEVRKAVQEPKFLKQIRYVTENSEFYHRKFKEIGLELRDIKSLDDLVKIPFTNKDEVRQSQEENPPLGLHMACHENKVLRIYSSSGTSGRPTYIGLTMHDLNDVWLNIIPRTYYATGMRPSDKLVFTTQVGPFVAGATLQGYERMGVTTIPLGPGQTERLISSYQIVGANVLMATPSYAEYLINWCLQRNIDTDKLGINKIVVAGEPGGSIPSIRRKIEEAFGGMCTEAMGMADISPSLWGECPEAKEGMHFCAQEYVLVELIDPESGKILEWKDGVRGELVYTAIDRQCVPLLRFRSRDHVQLWSSKCICGRTSPRVRVFGRTDDMLIVLGVNVFPAAVKAVVNEFRPRTTGEIQILLTEPGHRVKPPVPIMVEYGANAGDLSRLKEDVEDRIRAKLVFRAAVELIPDNTLPRYEYKGKLVRKVYEEE